METGQLLLRSSRPGIFTRFSPSARLELSRKVLFDACLLAQRFLILGQRLLAQHVLNLRTHLL